MPKSGKDKERGGLAEADQDQYDSADMSCGKRVSFEARRKALTDKFASELQAADSMSPEELRRLRR